MTKDAQTFLPGIIPPAEPIPTQGFLPGLNISHGEAVSDEEVYVSAEAEEIYCHKAHHHMTPEEAYGAVLGNGTHNADDTCRDICGNQCIPN